MLQVLLSGQAGLAVDIHGVAPRAWTLDQPDAQALSRSEANALLLGCDDVRRATFTNEDALKSELKTSLRANRGVWLMLMLFDESEPENELTEVADTLDSWLCIVELQRRVLNTMYSAPLPDIVSLSAAHRAIKVTSEFTVTHDLVVALWERQPAIRRVREAFNTTMKNSGDGFDEDPSWLQIAIASGAFRRLVEALDSPTDFDFLTLKLRSELRSRPGSAEILTKWSHNVRTLQNRSSFHMPRQIREVEEAEEPGYDPNQRWTVQPQIVEITRRLSLNDIQTAERFASALIRQQSVEGQEPYLAKTLCNLAQEAKRYGIPRLQLQWTEQAVSVAPDDAWAHGQYADALMDFERFAEAERSISIAEPVYPSFAATAKARILRRTGKLNEALDAYESARERFGSLPDGHFAYAGVAEVYRDLGLPDLSLNEYERAEREFPNDAAIKSGKAAVLVELGRYDEALRSYSRAIRIADDRLVPLNGRASLYKQAGRLGDAKALYEKIISDFPNDVTAFCGKADVLRLEGNLPEALETYNFCIERFSNSLAAYLGKATTLRQQTRFLEADEAYLEGTRKFPHERSLLAGRAAIQRSLGHFDKALALFEQALSANPLNLQFQVGRALMLSNLGLHANAIDAIEAALTSAPRNRSAMNARAQILIRAGDFDGAITTLDVIRATTESEWSSILISALLDARRGRVDLAANTLSIAAGRVPFARERRMIKSALAGLRLRQGRVHEAIKAIESVPGEVSSIVHLHVEAASSRDNALTKLASLMQMTPDLYPEVRNEIVRRYSLGGVIISANKSLAWLFDQEEAMLIAEAA